MSENLKEQFEQLCKEFGMNVSVAFNIFVRAVVKERKIPFEISANPKPRNNFPEITDEDGVKKFVVSKEGFEDFIKSCLIGYDDWTLSKKDLAIIKEIKDIKVIK